MTGFEERHAAKIKGVLNCWDRVLIQGTLPQICYAQGMTSYLHSRKIRIFDYAKEFADPLREKLRDNAEQIAKANNLEIECIRKKNFRKEDRIQKILQERGKHPGLVHIFSAMEPCSAYSPWHDKKTHKTFLKAESGKCLHYYFYLIHPELGLCFVRVPTWCPFRLQIYFNGHNVLAHKLTKQGIDFELEDNAFFEIGDWDKAQQLADDLNIKQLHQGLDALAGEYCPIIKELGIKYHWSSQQTEYATDLVFKRADDLQPIYENISRSAVNDIKADNIATFLGKKKLHGNDQREVGNRFDTRIQGTRIKHTLGSVSIKMYDKFGSVLRIETTVNNPSFFKHYRKVEHRDGTETTKFAAMKKGIYSLPALGELLRASNRRYLEFISELDQPSGGIKQLDKIAHSVKQEGRSYRGLNFFIRPDQDLLTVMCRGEFMISGMSNKQLRHHLKNVSSSQVSRLLKRLRLHGLIKKVGGTYKYYLTKLGRQAAVLGLQLKHQLLIPALA